MTTVNVTRRHITRNYFDESSGGYLGGVYIPSSTTPDVIHVEKGMLTDLDNSSDDHSIVQAFGESFLTTPITLVFKVYRYFDNGDGWYNKADVVHSHTSPFPGIAGFVIEIAAFEDLTGVIIEYKFEEI